MRTNELVAVTLILSLTMGSQARAQESRVVVDRTAIEQALTARSQADDASRASIRSLLDRDEVKAMAGDLGLDLRRADSAISTLQGSDLARVADRAAIANDLLEGGAQTIQISLVSLLLIVIIIILLAD